MFEKWRRRMDLAISTVLAGVAVTMLGWMVADRSEARAETDVREVAGWEDLAAEGIWTGRRDAPVVVTEFVDFQCPYCRASRAARDSTIAGIGDDVAFVHHHFPLPHHEHAVRAAITAECAESIGAFDQVAGAMLMQQDSLGLKPWTAFLEHATEDDARMFAECVERPVDSFPRIARGVEIGELHGVRGTPTIWVNGRVTPWPALPAAIQQAQDD